MCDGLEADFIWVPSRHNPFVASRYKLDASYVARYQQSDFESGFVAYGKEDESWEVIFSLRRTVEGRDFRARQFHLFTSIPGYLFVGVLFLVVVLLVFGVGLLLRSKVPRSLAIIACPLNS